MKESLQTFLNHISELGGDARPLIFEQPATDKEVADIEKSLNYKLPQDFKQALLNYSSHCEFSWFLPDDFILPDEFSEVSRGELHWDLKYLVPFNESKDDWVKALFPNPDDEYHKVWHNKFVFMAVGNGDYLSIDLSDNDYGKIVYLSHDYGEGHGYIMANSFTDLLHNWVQLGCVGSDGWLWVLFCDDKYSGINPNCANAILWKNYIS